MKIDFNKVVSIDIETIPRDQNFSTESPMFSTWKSKNRKKELSDEELIALHNSEGALHGEYCQIVAIAVTFIHEGKAYGMAFTGEEKDILDDLITSLGDFIVKRGGIQLIGANHTNFDLPVIRMRYSSYYPLVSFPQYLSDIIVSELETEKPWVISEKYLDILQVHKGARYSYSSLAEIMMSLNLESPKLDTNGSMVAQLYRDGELERIAKYCVSDTYGPIQVLYTWMGLRIPELIIRDKSSKPTPTSPLKKITLDIPLTDKEQAKLDVNIEQLSDKEKKIALEILEAAKHRDKALFGN